MDLLVDALPAGTATVTIYRSYQGTRSVIRQANAAPTMGASSRPYIDAEPPLSQAITYSAYATSAAGAQLDVAQAAPVTVVSDQAWISDPLAPGRATPVIPINESMEEIEHVTPGTISDVIDSALPIASMGTTQTGNFQLVLMAPTAMISGKYRLVLQYANPFLLRIPPSWNYDLPSLAYLAHTGYVTKKASAVLGERDYLSLSVTAVQPPPSPVVLPARTYGDVRDEATTYGGLASLWPSYLDLLRG
ncbi:hypothetical protein [Nakamurella lactea]|uniref:hypothetical protein n=1 Tax=Nakamurella lactea TaxID=459515 RepID=UPI0012B5DA32|nr:hypothetical protein [Nakamurella lactea]